MRYAVISALAAAFVGLSGCGDKTTSPAGGAAYFPENIGSTWVYSVYDSLSEHSYDMTVSVIDTTTLRDLPVKVWVYDGDGRIDTDSRRRIRERLSYKRRFFHAQHYRK